MQHVPLAEAMDAAGHGRFQHTLCVVFSLSNITDGMEMLLLAFLYLPLQAAWNLSEVEIGMVGSAAFVGVFFGAMLFGILADKRGRRFAYICALATVAIFGVLSAAATGLWMLAFFRLGVGAGMGGVGPAVWSNLSEFVRADKRGTVLTAVGASWAIGGLLECLFAFLILSNDPGGNWRLLIIVTAIPAFISAVVAFVWAPESPRLLALANKEEELRALLCRIADANGTREQLDKCLEGKTLDLIVVDSSARGSVSDLFAPGVRLMTVCVWIVWIVNVFVYYGSVFILPAVVQRLSDAGTVNDNVYAASALGAVLEGVGNALAAVLVDATLIPGFGRQWQLSAFMASTAFFAVLPVFLDGSITAIVGCIMMLRLCISGSFALIWTFTTELYPTAVRATGLGAASAVSRVGGVITPVASALLVGVDVIFPFIAFGVVSFVGALAILVGVDTDTKGAELEDTMDEHIQHVEEARHETVSLLAKQK